MKLHFNIAYNTKIEVTELSDKLPFYWYHEPNFWNKIDIITSYIYVLYVENKSI